MKDLNIIGAEVYAVLNKMTEEMYNKVPKNILKMFKKFEKGAKEVELKNGIPFDEQKISKEAKDIIFAISLNYWLTEEERKEVLKKLKENEDALNEKYKVDNMFKKISKQNTDINTENKEIVKEQKEKWYIKIFNKVKDFFYRK